MLTGLVCQLYYHGGGQLQYQNTLGVSSLVRFLSAPFVLQLGQKVSFSLLEGTSEAVDLRHPTSELIPTLTARSDSKATLAVRSVRFQRSIGRFLNAEAEERSEMIAHAERRLEILIHDESPDGDAICRIVRRCAGWLHAPVFATKEVSKEAAGPSKDGKGCSENLQSRVRKLLISCLAHLDLADANTQEALEPALEYLVQILDKLDFPTHLPTLATGQWRKLQKLLDCETRSETGAKTLAMEKPPKVRRTTKVSEVQGSFVPPVQVKSLPEVFTSEQSVKIKCSQCEYIISSNWYWRHPKTKNAHVLVPSMGHAACEKRLGRRISKCAWVPLEHVHTKLAHANHLLFCEHNQRKSSCVQCGGREICPHQKRRLRCKVCQKANVEDRKRVKVDTDR